MLEQESLTETPFLPASRKIRQVRKNKQRSASKRAGTIGSGRLEPMAAHDLLSPLSTIASLSTWIADEYSDRLGPDGREWFNLLEKSVERMRAVIENWSHSPVVDDVCRDSRSPSIPSLRTTVCP
jgi:light-regulated signal transduction histidine kinase (bacteriophytochrome)